MSSLKQEVKGDNLETVSNMFKGLESSIRGALSGSLL